MTVIKSFITDISLPALATDEDNVPDDVSRAGSALEGACLPPCAALEVQGNSERRKENEDGFAFGHGSSVSQCLLVQLEVQSNSVQRKENEDGFAFGRGSSVSQCRRKTMRLGDEVLFPNRVCVGDFL